MFSKSSIASVFGLVATINAHMIMLTPVPYGKSTINNSPLNADGTDFPCKQRAGVYDVESASNTMALGSSHDLSFTGSATHGGGSCQVSITYDDAPTASSTFKVIHSIIGGCPIMNVAGNNDVTADPDTYNFTIPTTIPTGNATLAWTWFNKIGNREMYMNCAPVTLTGSSSKRSEIEERDTAAYDALPDMFVANIGNGCGTADSLDLLFPNPGDSVEFDGGATKTATAAPTGSCAAATGGSVAASATASAVAASSVVATSSAAGSGGVFATIPVSSAASVATQAPTSVAPVASSVASSSTPASTGTSSSGAVLTGACTTDGMYNCISGTSFQQCASGVWSVEMAMADGTTCTSGQTMSLAVAAVNVKDKRAPKPGRHFGHFARAHSGLGEEMFVV